MISLSAWDPLYPYTNASQAHEEGFGWSGLGGMDNASTVNASSFAPAAVAGELHSPRASIPKHFLNATDEFGSFAPGSNFYSGWAGNIDEPGFHLVFLQHRFAHERLCAFRDNNRRRCALLSISMIFTTLPF